MSRLLLLMALCAALLMAGLAGLYLGGPTVHEVLTVEPAGALRQQYLLDLNYELDEDTGYATLGHLLLFNPADAPTQAVVRIFFEDQEPKQYELTVPAKTTKESNFSDWPVQPGQRIALEVRSEAPLIAQSTQGWNNTANVYTLDAETDSPMGRRETARSSLAIRQLADRWFIADGVVLDLPEKLWIRESEWALLLNPSDETVEVSMQLYYAGYVQVHSLKVQPRRVRAVLMDDIVDDNRNYGVQILGDQPIAVQWLRKVFWWGSNEEMTSWSVPAAPLHSASSPR